MTHNSLRDEVRRCKALLARRVPLGILGRALTWWNRARSRRMLKRSKDLLEVVAELEGALELQEASKIGRGP